MGKFQITSTKFQKNSTSQNPNSNIEIVDYLGKVVFQSNPEPGTRNPELDISQLPSGIYFVRIFIDNQMFVQKIVKI